MTYLLNTNSPNTNVFLDSINAESIMELDESTGACTSEFVWYLQPPVQAQLGQSMILSLIDCQFPNVFPNVVTGVNDKIVYSLDSGATLITKTIPSSHYDVETLVSWLNENTSPFVWLIDYVTYKLTITCPSSTIYIHSSSSCGNVIGLTKDRLGNFVTYSSGIYNTGTLLSWFNLSGTPYVFLKIRNISVSTMDTGEGNESTLARIDLNCPFGSVVFYRPAVVEQHLLPIKAFDNIHVFLTDHHGNPLCLKGLNLQMSIRVSYIEDIMPIQNQERFMLDQQLQRDEFQHLVARVPLQSYNLEKNVLGSE
jgi:hypothetical protein